MCRAHCPLPTVSVRSEAAAGLLALATSCDAELHAKRQCLEPKRAALVCTAPLCATGERWSLVSDGARMAKLDIGLRHLSSVFDQN
eukprot:scaffold11029_cov135-Isochrysis_galbana.AAC.2